MYSHPLQSEIEPERLCNLFDFGPLREWRKPESHVFRAVLSNCAHSGVEQKLRCTIRCAVTANDLLHEPALSLRYRREDSKAYHFALTSLGDENSPVIQAAKRFGLDHEVKRRKMSRREPFIQRSSQCRMIGRDIHLPLAHCYFLVASAVELRAQRTATRNAVRPRRGVPNRLGAKENTRPRRIRRVIRFQPCPRPEVADAIADGMCVGEKLGRDLLETRELTNWCSADNSRPRVADVANYRITGCREPEINSRIEQLVSCGVPTVGENECARSLAVRDAGARSPRRGPVGQRLPRM